MTITPEQLQAMRARANVSSAVMPAVARDIHTLAAEVERLQALLAPTRAPDAVEPCPGSRGW